MTNHNKCLHAANHLAFWFYISLLSIVSGLGNCSFAYGTGQLFATSKVDVSRDDLDGKLPSINELALKLMDSEALYTISGGIKPLSEGFWSIDLTEVKESARIIENARNLLRKLPLGSDYRAGLLVFHNDSGTPYHATAYVAHLRSVQQLVRNYPTVFYEPSSVHEPSSATTEKESDRIQQLLEKVERSRGEKRFRAFGLLFAYPEYAVEFFIQADQRKAGPNEIHPRDFFHIPTVASETGRFVYAVPKGHVPNSHDRKLRAQCIDILERYRAKRELLREQTCWSASCVLAEWVTPVQHPKTVCSDQRVRCSHNALTRPSFSKKPMFSRAY